MDCLRLPVAAAWWEADTELEAADDATVEGPGTDAEGRYGCGCGCARFLRRRTTRFESKSARPLPVIDSN